MSLCLYWSIYVKKCRYAMSIFVDIGQKMSKNVDTLCRYLFVLVDIGRYMSKNVDFCVDICRKMSISAEFVTSMSVDVCRYMSKIVDIADRGGPT